MNLYEFPQENKFFVIKTWMHADVCTFSTICRLSWLAHSLNFVVVYAECWESLAKNQRGLKIGFHVVAKFPGMHEEITQRFLPNVPLGRMTRQIIQNL